MKKNFFIQVISISISVSAFAAEPTKSTTTEFEYPELLVSPSASERLQQESKSENKNKLKEHWAIQTSALTTLIASVMAGSDPGKQSESDNDKPQLIKTANLAGLIVSSSWLAITGTMSFAYSPYQNGNKELSGLPRGSRKELLGYERRAEEAIESPARVSKVMKWSSFISNAAVGGLIAASANNNSTKVFGGVAIINSFLPILFDHTWELNHKYQDDYKHRVYGPISSNDFKFELRADNMVAGIWTTGIQF